MCRGVVLLCVVHVCVVHLCVASRILAVFPVPSRSHAVLSDSIVHTLLDAGHEVTYVTPFTNLNSRTRLTNVDISSVKESIIDKERLNLMELVKNPRPPQRALEVGTTFARRVLQHESMREILLDPDVSYDVVLAEWFYSGLLAPLGTLFDCPLIWYTATDASWMTLQLMHEQSSSAYSVDSQARSMASPPYTTRDRGYRLWRQTYLSAWVYYMTHYVEAPAYQKIYQTPLELRERKLPEYESLLYNASFLLINSHPLLGQSLSLPENAKYIGAHHIEYTTKTLPKYLQDLLDEAKNGAIFFSLGSNIKSEDLPWQMRRELLQVFRQLEQTVIWKFAGHLEDLPKNVHIVDWAPQKSILNHSNTVLFISHGGFISYTEATYYGVPFIGIPLFGDQFVTTDLAADRGRGIRVDFSNELPFKIKEAINEVLGNYSQQLVRFCTTSYGAYLMLPHMSDSRKSTLLDLYGANDGSVSVVEFCYRSNAAQSSSIFQNSLITPQRELVYWIELVINTRGATHLRSPARQISTFDRLYLDIVALIVMFLWFLSKVLKVIKVHLSSSEEHLDRKND